MRKILIVLLSITSLNALAQTSKVGFDGSKWSAPYTLNTPAGWDVERFIIPIEFAPEILYTGVEDIRFTPGWGNAKSNDYWTYAFLWYLDGRVKTDARIIENNLKSYYTGLVGRNIIPRKIAADKLFPVKTKITKAKTERGDLKTFRGTIFMLDYMEQKPIILNCIVHLKSCAGQNKTYIFNELSPRSFNDKIWQSLNQLWTGFSCEKALSTK